MTHKNEAQPWQTNGRQEITRGKEDENKYRKIDVKVILEPYAQDRYKATKTFTQIGEIDLSHRSRKIPSIELRSQMENIEDKGKFYGGWQAGKIC